MARTLGRQLILDLRFRYRGHQDKEKAWPIYLPLDKEKGPGEQSWPVSWKQMQPSRLLPMSAEIEAAHNRMDARERG